MEPKRGIITREVPGPGIVLVPSRYVWILGPARKGYIPVETASHRIEIPEDSVLACPVPRPDLRALRRADACFGKSRDFFVEEHNSEESWYRLLRCKKHRRLFLEDTRGGIASYTRLILIEETADAPDTIWSRYHAMSDDWLNCQGIAY